MIKKSKDAMSWLEFELFADFKNLHHGIFLRDGGESTGNYSSLNLGDNTADDPHTVLRNRKKAQSITSLPNFSWMQQCHGKSIQEVKEASKSPISYCDGIISNRTGIGLAVVHADCQAAIMYDPIRKAIASVHCGWRGSVQNIYSEALFKMKNTFGSKPEDIFVGISPSLGPENAQFLNYRTELPESFWAFMVKEFYFDFWEITFMQLKQCGILPNHIQMARIDTYQVPEDWFSYRREKETGRNATFIGLLG
jgi:YfiH family protein